MYKNLRKKNGITLVALVVTVIILLILAGISIAILTGNGLFEKAKLAEKETTKKNAIEIMNIKIANIQISNYTENENLSSLQQLADKLCEDDDIEYVLKASKKNASLEKIDVKNVYSIFTKLKNFPYEFEIGNNLKIASIDGIEYEIKEEYNESLLGKIRKLNTSGEQTISVKYKEKNEEKVINYNINLIIYNGTLILDGKTSVEGATLDNNVYQFGDKASDVATETEDAKNMVILKVNGNLIINEGVTLTSCKSDDNYGGPKGFTIFCKGTIINNGTISMTARGAKAEGQNVYLWQNDDGSYEYVPAIGALGGTEIISGGNRNVAGNNGNDGINRQTGGGGTGSGYVYKKTITISAGGSGTSYSGGCGSGSATSDGGGSWSVTSEAGSSVGGKGGNGVDGSSNSSAWGYVSIGGTGNPTGNYKTYRQSSLNYTQRNGTGGLLIVYSNEIINNGIIESEGVSSSISNLTSQKGGVYTAGASGGGSINIFYNNQFLNNGVCSANGGKAINGIGDASTISGGAGGDGTVTLTKIN